MALMLIIFISYSASAFNLTNPSDQFYRDINFWQERGYLGNLPPLRPYPEQLAFELLKEVERKGSPGEREKAQYYMEKLKGTLSIHVDTQFISRFTSSGYRWDAGALGVIKGTLGPYVSLWHTIGGYLIDGYQQSNFIGRDVYEYGNRQMHDTKPDWASIGSLKPQTSYTGLTALGTSNIYVQAGLARSSFGDFSKDGLVVSPKAPEQGHFDFVLLKDTFSLTSSTLELTASTNDGSGIYPEKFLALHSFNWQPVHWAELGFIEGLIYGERIEPLYLLPFSWLFYSQGFVGFVDNSYMGASGRFSLPGNVEINGILYVDDAHFNDLIRLNFDTKYKVGLQAGINWSPGKQWLRRMELNYSLISPYMYTHWDSPATNRASYSTTTDYANSINYENYTHLGENLGITLDPNSDRISFSYVSEPIKNLSFELGGTYIRHGNGSRNPEGNLIYSKTDNTEDGISPNGDIFDDGVDSDGTILTNQSGYSTYLLSQPVIEKITQLSLSGKYRLDTGKTGEFSCEIGYTIENIQNGRLEGPDTSGYLTGEPFPGNNSLNHYVWINAGWSY